MALLDGLKNGERERESMELRIPAYKHCVKHITAKK